MLTMTDTTMPSQTTDVVAAQPVPVTVLDRITGEVLDLAEASLLDLASWMAHMKQITDAFKDEEAAVNTAILAILDDGQGHTRRVGDPRVAQLEVSAASPDAGTTGWDEDLLEIALDELVAAKKIAEGAAAGALKRQINVGFQVPFNVDLDQAADAITEAMDCDATFEVAGTQMRVTAVNVVKSAQSAGINRLLKLPAAKDDVAACRVPKRAPARKVKVKPVTRDGVR